MRPEYEFSAELWVYGGDAAWYFVTLPTDIAKEIKEFTPPRRGFGSLRVKASIGPVEWNTSIFPDKQSGSFLLPVKKEIRAKTKVGTGDIIRVSIALTNI